jgi:predicted PhzF superfamily epimerase YddE/YHI9
VGRPSRIEVTLDDDGVSIAGSGSVVATGRLHL